MKPPITAQAVYKWEHGLSVPGARNLDKLSRLTGKSVKWFLYGVEDGDLAGRGDLVTQAGRVVPMVPYSSINNHLDGDENAKTGHVRANFPCSSNSFQTFADDDANHPVIQIGFSVIIDLDRPPRPGKFCLAVYNGKPVIRRYRPRNDHVELVPENDHWPTLKVEPSAILGAVTEITQPH